MTYLLIVYFCLAGDVCDRYTTNSSSFYVGSCNEEFLERQVEHIKKNETSSIEIDVVDYECINLL